MASYLDVFRRLRVEKNGAVSDAMSERGLSYGMNYGVSLVTIRDVAREFGHDHSLAADLWRQEVRELRLAAIYVEQPEAVETPQLEKWGSELGTVEVAQIFGRELLALVPKARETIAQWLLGDEMRRTAACAAVARLAAQENTEWFEALPLDRLTAQPLRELFKHHRKLRPAIQALAPQVNDLEWQLHEILLDEGGNQRGN